MPKQLFERRKQWIALFKKAISDPRQFANTSQ